MQTIVIDVGATTITSGLVSKNKITSLTTIPTNRHSSFTNFVLSLKKLIDSLISSSVKNIVLVVPCVINNEGKITQSFNIPALKNKNLNLILKKYYSQKIIIENDANLFILSQAKLNEKLVLGLTLGSGLGMGIVYQGNLIKGHNGSAGEIGRIPYLNATFEDYCSEKFFKKNYSLSAKELYLLAKSGDSLAKKSFKEFATHLSEVLLILSQTLNPQTIYIGGGLAKAKPFISSKITSSLKKRCYYPPKIVFSTTSGSQLLGANKLLSSK